METWQTIIMGLLGVSFIGDIILHFVLPSRRRKDNAESKQAEHDADKAEVDRLHLQIKHQQESLEFYIKRERDSAARIVELNNAMDSKTEQIRKLTEQVIASEHGRNADKDEVARLASENGDLRALLEYEKQWRCVLTDCHDERGRQPPNEKLKGKKYNPPKRTAQDTL